MDRQETTLDPEDWDGLRACITNHRTTRGDLETLVESAVMMGRAMAEEMKKR